MSSDNQVDRPRPFNAVPTIGLVLMFAIAGTAVVRATRPGLESLASQENTRLARMRLAEQLALIRESQRDFLIYPEPCSVEGLLIDEDCRGRIREIYLAENLSDARLGGLRELPNLRTIVFLFANNADAFLANLRRKESVEWLSFDHSPVSRRGVESLATLPKLKTLCISASAADLVPLHNHPTLESFFVFARTEPDRLIPILKTMPRLRSVTVQTLEEWPMIGRLADRLKSELPNCESKVEEAEHAW